MLYLPKKLVITMKGVELTKAEEEVMLVLWELELASVKEVLEHYEHPRPAYNTISTIIRILEKKKVVGHKQKGRGYIYFPKISKGDYAEKLTKHLVLHYFNNNRSELISSLNSKKSLHELL